MSKLIRRGGVLIVLAALLLPAPVWAAPQRGFELVVQHATEDTDGISEPQEFPVSGALTGTLAWPLGSRFRVTTGLGYEERWTQSGATLEVFLNQIHFDRETRARSFVVPLHFGALLGRHLEVEAGPEWRWMLQTRARLTVSPPTLAGTLTESSWRDVTSDRERSTFALSAGLAAHWPLQRGEARVGFRWCEALGNQIVDKSFPVTSRFRELQLTFAWSR